MNLIYMHRNTVNGKSYIGLTTKGMVERWRQHQYTAFAVDGNDVYKSNVKFHKAIRKYPDDVWEHLVLHEATNDESLQELEVYYINKYNTYHRGYNSTLGGDGLSGEAARAGMVANRKDYVKGYTWSKERKSWRVQLAYLGKMLIFGCFKEESDAKARADYLFSLSDEEFVKAHEEYKTSKTSRTKGYSFNESRGKYRVRLTVNGKSKHFGYYNTEQEAVDRVSEILL